MGLDWLLPVPFGCVVLVKLQDSCACHVPCTRRRYTARHSWIHHKSLSRDLSFHSCYKSGFFPLSLSLSIE